MEPGCEGLGRRGSLPGVFSTQEHEERERSCLLTGPAALMGSTTTCRSLLAAVVRCCLRGLWVKRLVHLCCDDTSRVGGAPFHLSERSWTCLRFLTERNEYVSESWCWEASHPGAASDVSRSASRKQGFYLSLLFSLNFFHFLLI